MAKKVARKKKTAAKKKKTAARRKPAKQQEMLLVGSKTKAALKDHGLNVAGDALDSLNAVIYQYIDQAAKRASANGRKTVRGHDFHV
ncbi:MAG TPA: hypothetical protein VKA86_04055 [Candidatus Krumholzibacteria bacterium]|nr:hypothetical protein [Candidatus Krumholzibacteria bacterium]